MKQSCLAPGDIAPSVEENAPSIYEACKEVVPSCSKCSRKLEWVEPRIRRQLSDLDRRQKADGPSGSDGLVLPLV